MCKTCNENFLDLMPYDFLFHRNESKGYVWLLVSNIQFNISLSFTEALRKTRG